MRHLRSLSWLLLFALVVVPVMAAVDCPTVVENALQATDELCEATGRNQACYGNVRVDAQPQPGVDDFDFNAVGDRVEVAALQSLRLSPMEADTGDWGVAMMRLQASLPSSQHQDITLLMFGDVEIENAVQRPQITLDVTVSVDEYINVRRLPSIRAGVMGVLAPGQTVRALERLANGSWLRVEIPESGVIGWLDASLVTSEGDLTTLGVTERWTPRYRPMQAFYFQSGQSDSDCGEAPTSGMLIQTPEGVGQVTLLINEVNVRIGSTAYFEAQPGQAMRVSTVEGAVQVEAMGVTHTAVAGSEVTVQLDEHNQPAAPPSRPRPYNQAEMQALPVEALDNQIEQVPAPLTQEEIEQVVAGDDAQNAPPPVEATEQSQSIDTPNAPVDTGSVSVESVCVGTWRARNTTAFEVAFTWNAVGNGATGGGTIGVGGETTFDASTDSVSITYDAGQGPQTAAATSNGQPCTGDTLPGAPTEEVTPTVEASPPTVESTSDVPTDEPTTAPADPPTQEAAGAAAAPPIPEPPSDAPTPPPVTEDTTVDSIQ